MDLVRESVKKQKYIIEVEAMKNIPEDREIIIAYEEDERIVYSLCYFKENLDMFYDKSNSRYFERWSVVEWGEKPKMNVCVK